jgi:hypothetical protein
MVAENEAELKDLHSGRKMDATANRDMVADVCFGFSEWVLATRLCSIPKGLNRALQRARLSKQRIIFDRCPNHVDRLLLRRIFLQPLPAQAFLSRMTAGRSKSQSMVVL